MNDEQKLIIRAIKKQNDKIAELEKDYNDLLDLITLISSKVGIKA